MQLALRVNVHEFEEFEPAIFVLLKRARNIFIKFRHVVSKRVQFTHVVNGSANLEEQKKLFAKAFKSHRICLEHQHGDGPHVSNYNKL